MDSLLVYIGIILLIVAVILSAISLLKKDLDIKRVATFATIGLFSGTILILGDRITTIRVPVLGEIVVKAREDAIEIDKTRQEVEFQRKK